MMSFNMFFSDPQAERLRLEGLYSAMSDAELERLDNQAHTLTAMAREVLECELDRREMTISQPEGEDPRSELVLQKLATIRKFRDLPEALLAKGAIESSGIECFLADDNMVRMDWFISNFIGGVKLQVHSEDEAAAQAVLDQPIPEEFDFSGIEQYQQPRCPKCRSLDISLESLNKPVAYATAYLGVPIVLERKSWKCHTCGRRWMDENSAPSQKIE
jgi:hypothetical protein